MATISEEALRIKRQANNPHNKPTGDFTGRCLQCGSKDLWDDFTAYGCNDCGMIRTGGSTLVVKKDE